VQELRGRRKRARRITFATTSSRIGLLDVIHLDLDPHEQAERLRVPVLTIYNTNKRGDLRWAPRADRRLAPRRRRFVTRSARHFGPSVPAAAFRRQ
jgi:hypothetical protein